MVRHKTANLTCESSSLSSLSVAGVLHLDIRYTKLSETIHGDLSESAGEVFKY